MAPKPDRVSISVTIRKDLVARLDAECDVRVVGRTFILERGLEGYFAHLDRLDAASPIVAPVEVAGSLGGLGRGGLSDEDLARNGAIDAADQDD